MCISEPTKIVFPGWVTCQLYLCKFPLPTICYFVHMDFSPFCAHAEMLMMNMTCQILTQSTHVYTRMHTRTHTHTHTRARTHAHTHGRLQSLDWTSGLDWWTDTKNHFYTF